MLQVVELWRLEDTGSSLEAPGSRRTCSESQATFGNPPTTLFVTTETQVHAEPTWATAGNRSGMSNANNTPYKRDSKLMFAIPMLNRGI